MIKRFLITVTTYPLPSDTYDELVCTAGFDENGTFCRLYPIPLDALIKNRFKKYDLIELDVEERDKNKDFRPNTFCPVNKRLDDIKIIRHINTENNWEERKRYCLNEIYTSKRELLKDAFKEDKQVSLAVFKPTKIERLHIEKDSEDWKDKFKEKQNQLCLLDVFTRYNIKKIPFKFKYEYRDSEGKKTKQLIEDWEIGALYWNCMKNCNNDKNKAIEKVRQQYEDNFINKKDIYFYLGTTLEWHRRKAKNPFVIVGVFYPLKEK